MVNNGATQEEKNKNKNKTNVIKLTAPSGVRWTQKQLYRSREEKASVMLQPPSRNQLFPFVMTLTLQLGVEISAPSDYIGYAWLSYLGIVCC